jgi:hypothetical protein
MTPAEFLSKVPPIQVEYWVEGRRLATRQIPSSPAVWYEESEFFTCNTCGEVWAWIFYPNRHWFHVYQDCPTHNSRRYNETNFPGSILSPGGFELDDLPLAILAREFEIHLREIERRQQHDDPSPL